MADTSLATPRRSARLKFAHGTTPPTQHTTETNRVPTGQRGYRALDRRCPRRRRAPRARPSRRCASRTAGRAPSTRRRPRARSTCVSVCGRSWAPSGRQTRRCSTTRAASSPPLFATTPPHTTPLPAALTHTCAHTHTEHRGEDVLVQHGLWPPRDAGGRVPERRRAAGEPPALWQQRLCLCVSAPHTHAHIHCRRSHLRWEMCTHTRTHTHTHTGTV